MEIKFQTKEESNQQQQEAFLKLSKVERFYNFLNLMERIRNDKDHINNRFLGDIFHYQKIYNQMKYIYMLRIKAWKKLINLH